MIFLTLNDICEINQEWIQRYGGRYIALDNNLCNRASLEYILEAIQYPIFGKQLFPRLIDKAAALAWWVIEGHIFNDGNKRTGMQAAIELFELNGATSIFDKESAVAISMMVANRQISLEELTDIFGMYVQTGSGDPYQI